MILCMKTGVLLRKIHHVILSVLRWNSPCIDQKCLIQTQQKLGMIYSIDNSWNFSNWQHFGAYLVEKIDKAWFNGVIKKKEKNITHYKGDFHEHWLLMVSDFGAKSSSKRFDGFDFSEIITKFDRIYLYSLRPDNITQMK